MDPCLELGDSVYASVCRQGDPLSAVLNQKISSLDMKRWEPAQIKMRVRDTSHLLMILSSVCLWAEYRLWLRHACQLYTVEGDSGEEMLTSSCLTLLESQMRPRVIINIITIIVWSRGFGGWWSFRDLLRRFMSLVGGCGPSVLKPLNQGDSAESEQGFKYRAPPLTSGCLDPSSSPIPPPGYIVFLVFNVLFTSSSTPSVYVVFLDVNSKLLRNLQEALRIRLPLPCLHCFFIHIPFTWMKSATCMFPRDPCSINV